MKKILKLDGIEELECVIMDNLSYGHPVSVVSDMETIWKIGSHLSREYGFSIGIVEIDNFEYDKEYIISVNENDDGFSFDITQAYNYDSDRYYGIVGITLVDFKVDDQFIKDVQEDKYIDNFTPIVYGFKEELNKLNDGHNGNCGECELEKMIDGTLVVYHVPICFDELIDKIDNIIDDFFEDCFR